MQAEAPESAVYEPEAHAVHKLAPAAALYVPVEQPVHTKEEVALAWLLYFPALQLAHMSSVALDAKYKPGAQAGHVGAVEYTPGGGTLETARTRLFE